MNNTIAKTLSYALHPLLMPTYIVLILILQENYIATNSLLLKLVLGIFFISTFLIPASLIPILYISEFVKSLELNERAERNIPLLLTSLSYWFCLYLINKIHASFPELLKNFPIAAFLCIFSATIINFKWKISLHLISIGGAAGLFIAATLKYGYDFQYFFMVTMLLAGVLGTARLHLNAHTPAQIFTGFGLGFIITTSFLILY